jgi:V/A-type H+-transporting ATPase subunit I
VVSTLSNTATFIRLAAFALSHAGLFLATFSVADAVAASGGMAGTLGALCVLVVGNLVIIALEGLIVAIQSVRLEYYEFFSKFYTGDGLEYRPLRYHTAAPVRP